MGQGFVRRLQRGAIALSVMTLGMMGHAGAEDGVIKIGAPLALSGGLASEGAKQKLAYDLWLERINALGGIDVGGVMMPVELITYDYQTDGKRAGQLAEKLIIDDKVDFLTATFG